MRVERAPNRSSLAGCERFSVRHIESSAQFNFFTSRFSLYFFFFFSLLSFLYLSFVSLFLSLSLSSSLFLFRLLFFTLQRISLQRICLQPMASGDCVVSPVSFRLPMHRCCYGALLLWSIELRRKRSINDRHRWTLPDCSQTLRCVNVRFPAGRFQFTFTILCFDYGMTRPPFDVEKEKLWSINVNS